MKKLSEIVENPSRKPEKFVPWNKGKVAGQKKPFTLKQVATIKNILSERGEMRDLALFSTAIDTALRKSDVLALTVGDVLDAKGEIRTRLNIRQKKTGKPHVAELSQYTREILRLWIAGSGKFEDDPLFAGTRKSKHRAISLRHFRDLVKKWAGYANVINLSRYHRANLSFRAKRSRGIPCLNNAFRQLQGIPRLRFAPLGMTVFIMFFSK